MVKLNISTRLEGKRLDPTTNQYELEWTHHAQSDMEAWLDSIGGVSRPVCYMTFRVPKGNYVLDVEQAIPDCDHVKSFLIPRIPASVLSHLRSTAMYVCGNPVDAEYWVFFEDAYTDDDWAARGTRAVLPGLG